jgi:hypothetical protein
MHESSGEGGDSEVSGNVRCNPSLSEESMRGEGSDESEWDHELVDRCVCVCVCVGSRKKHPSMPAFVIDWL